MRIEHITVYRVELPYVGGTYHWAKGKSVSVADSTVVRIDTDAGLTGWGETCPLGSNYLPAFAGGLRAGIAELAPHLLGQDPSQIGRINALMDEVMRGQNYVKSALDVACWDILGKVAGLPLHALLGGRQNEGMAMYRAVPQESAEGMAAAVRGFRAGGYRQFQLKVGGTAEDDIARIRAVAEALEPGEILIADGNTGWRRDEALRVAAATDDLDYYLEQPCLRYEDCRAVAARAAQPMKLDESLQGVDDILRAVADEALDVLAIKVSKLGGLTKAKLARDLSAALGLPMTVEDVWGGEVATAAMAHLAASTPSAVLMNTTDLHNYNTVHLAVGAPESRDGRLFVSDAPGLGIEPLLEVLGEPVAVYD